jgi:hypothetical protein
MEGLQQRFYQILKNKERSQRKNEGKKDGSKERDIGRCVSRGYFYSTRTKCCVLESKKTTFRECESTLEN